MALLRGGIYVFFVLAVIAGWVLKNIKSSSSHEASDTSQPDIQTQEQAVAALKHSNWRVRLQAVNRLAMQSPARHVTALVSALGDDDPDVRQTAADALVSLGERAVSPLVDTLETDSLTKRETAANVLADIATPLALDALATALQSDESAWVRICAAKALGETGSREYVPALVAALRDSHRGVYDASVQALQFIGTQEALHVIQNHPYTPRHSPPTN